MILIVLLKVTLVNRDSMSKKTNLQPFSNNSLGISQIFFSVRKES